MVRVMFAHEIDWVLHIQLYKRSMLVMSSTPVCIPDVMALTTST
jgi:hypothetical protein